MSLEEKEFKIDNNIFTYPTQNYIRYKQKQRDYDKLYYESSLRYYGRVAYRTSRKIVKKKLVSSFKSAIFTSIGFIFIYQIGLMDYLMERFTSFLHFFIRKKQVREL